MADDWNDSDIERPEYKDEYKARERAGPAGLLGSKSNRVIQDPRELFQSYVNAISRRDFELSEDEIATLIEKIDMLDNVEHKNPTAYILGYLASGNGKKITKTSIDKTFNDNLPGVGDKSVQKEDVLRYARLWVTHINK